MPVQPCQGRICSAALGPAAAVLSRTCILPSSAGHACLQACSCCSNAALDSNRITPCSCRAKLQGRRFTGNLSGWPELGQSLFISAPSINTSMRGLGPLAVHQFKMETRRGVAAQAIPVKHLNKLPPCRYTMQVQGSAPAAVQNGTAYCCSSGVLVGRHGQQDWATSVRP